MLKPKSGSTQVRGSVQVFDEGGRDLTGISSVIEMQSGMLSGGYTRGETKLGPVPPGRYRVVITRDGETEERRVTLRGEPERVITLSL